MCVFEGALEAQSQQFESTVVKIRRKYWWNNFKVVLVEGGTEFLLFILSAFVVLLGFVVVYSYRFKGFFYS
jgi:hypothetical protein